MRECRERAKGDESFQDLPLHKPLPLPGPVSPSVRWERWPLPAPMWQAEFCFLPSPPGCPFPIRWAVSQSLEPFSPSACPPPLTLLSHLPFPFAPFLGSLLFSMPPTFAHSVLKHWLFFPCLGLTGEVATTVHTAAALGPAFLRFPSFLSGRHALMRAHTHTHTHTHTHRDTHTHTHTHTHTRDRKWAFQTVCSALARQPSDFSVAASKSH